LAVQGIEGVEKFLLGRIFTGDKLNVIGVLGLVSAFIPLRASAPIVGAAVAAIYVSRAEPGSSPSRVKTREVG